MNKSRVFRTAHIPIKIRIYILGEQLAKKINAFKYCETSAKTGEGVKEAFNAAIIATKKERLFGLYNEMIKKFVNNRYLMERM